LDQILFTVKVNGFKPILAHPERYSYYYGKKNRYEQIHAAGTRFQVNILSLAGFYGKEEKNIAEWLLQHGMVDFLGTDLHNHRHADAIEAYLASKDYRRNLEAITSYVQNDRLF
jgi:tyrosine-protein phosphatase YwqE